jgi:hypothetical protein
MTTGNRDYSVPLTHFTGLDFKPRHTFVGKGKMGILLESQRERLNPDDKLASAAQKRIHPSFSVLEIDLSTMKVVKQHIVVKQNISIEDPANLEFLVEEGGRYAFIASTRSESKTPFSQEGHLSEKFNSEYAAYGSEYIHNSSLFTVDLNTSTVESFSFDDNFIHLYGKPTYQVKDRTLYFLGYQNTIEDNITFQLKKLTLF